MPWIPIIPPAAATGELAEMYAHMKEPDGSVDNILTIHSLRPQSLRTHFELYKDVMYGRSELSRAQREMIAVVVSVTNHCVY